jgi:Tol biopolymer transport system component
MRVILASMTRLKNVRTLVLLGALVLAAAAVAPAALGTTPGANGLIVFTHGYKGHPSELLSMRSDGTDVHRLTSNGADNASVSPNGRRVAFVTDGGGSADSRLMSVGIDGEGLRTGVDGYRASYPTWAPTGKRIAFSGSHDGVGIFVASASGTHVHAVRRSGQDGIRTPAYPAWSPNGRRIAFTAIKLHYPGYGLGRRFLYTVRPHGSHLTRVASDADIGVDWAPNGRHIVYSDVDQQIMIVGAHGGHPRPVHSSGHVDLFPSYSPDGRSIAYQRAEVARRRGSKVCTMTTDGAHRECLREGSDPSWQSMP